MPCVPVPSVAVPSIFPLTAAPTLPDAPAFNPALCCKVAPFPAPPPLPPLPPGIVNPAFVKTLRTYGKQVQAFLDGLQLPCPRQ